VTGNYNGVVPPPHLRERPEPLREFLTGERHRLRQLEPDDRLLTLPVRLPESRDARREQ
jgi:hypothetical protein